jgi:uncharacterized protein (DUF1330 family)
MSAYIVVEIDVFDTKGFDTYRQQVPSTIEKYGGRYIVRGGKVETLEGDWCPKRFVVLEFPSAERAKAWWNSVEYAESKALRQACANSRMILVEGTV